MTQFLKKNGAAITGIVLSVLFSVIAVGALKSTKLGDGIYNQVAQYFYQGLYAGTSNQFAIDANGAVTTSGTITSTATITVNGVVLQMAQGTGVSTTTSACIIPPPTATSTFAASYKISSSSPNTTVLAIGTSTNPYATTSASSLITQTNTASQVRPVSYAAKSNMFATTLDYILVYYTGGTTSQAGAQQQLGTCSAMFTAL